MNRFAALCMLTVLLTGIGHAQTTGATHSAACTNPEYRQLDFWLGDWDVYEVSDSARAVARNRVTRILDGCVLRELYQQQNGMVGESYSLWDASRRVWHQSWVTNRGTLLLLDGHLDGDRMVLTGPDKTAEGRPALIRGIWWAEGQNVREKAERSTDGGKTWQPVFDIVFQPHRER
jgi:hypothetical protein